MIVTDNVQNFRNRNWIIGLRWRDDIIPVGAEIATFIDVEA